MWSIDETGRPKLGVVLVDPLSVVRAGLGLIVQREPDMELLGHAATAAEAIELIRGLRHTDVVVLVGTELEGNDGAFWLIRALRERFPSCSILGLGSNARRQTVSRALFVGADGFVDKNADPSEFVDALRRVHAGETVLTGTPKMWLGGAEDGESPARPAPSLTQREQQVLTIAAEGLTARQIGDRLGLRERTITTHLARIYGKLGVNSRIGAISTATRSGLVMVDAAV